MSASHGNNTTNGRQCVKCMSTKLKEQFSNNQWKKGPASAKCKACVRGLSSSEEGSSSRKRKRDDDVTEAAIAKERKYVKEYVEDAIAKERQQREAAIAALKARNSQKGVTTREQFYQQLHIERCVDMQRIWARKSKLKMADLPAGFKPKEPAEKAVETCKTANSVQNIITQCLKDVVSIAKTKEWESIPDPIAYAKQSFLGRMPDVVNYRKGMTESLGITGFGDLKPRGSGDFSDEQKGHVLDMARTFMEHVGLCRPFLIVFLSDGVRWQFFRVVRKGRDELTYLEAPVVIDAKKTGWKHFIMMLTNSPSHMGCVEPSLEGVKLHTALGRGGSSVVYKAFRNNTEVLVKLYYSDRHESFERETSALRKLSDEGVLGVPRVEETPSLAMDIKGFGQQVLVVTPVGIPYLPRAAGVRCRGKHLQKLVEIVRKAHEAQLEHRDIKPDNVYEANGSMLLNDWGSSITLSEKVVLEGTSGFSVFEKDTVPAVRDLISVVRTAYSLLFHELPPAEPNEIAQFWRDRLRKGSYWGKALGYAKALKYKKLSNCLEKMK